MNRKILRFVIACLLAVILCVMTACGTPHPKKIVGVYGAGGSFYVMSRSGEPYSVDGVPSSCNGKFITLDGYVRSRKGTYHDVLDAKGKRISSIRLLPEDEAFTGRSIDVDISANGPVLTVGEDISNVRLWSSAPGSSPITVLVEERDMPLSITLDNVSIFTQQRVPFLISPNDADIILNVTGHCGIVAGSDDMSADDFAQYRQIMEEIKNGQYTWSDLKDLYLDAVVLCYSFIGYSCERLSESITSGSFANDFIAFTDVLCDKIESALDVVYGFYSGEDGANGIDGVPAFMTVGGIELKGSGHLTVFGGDGSDGQDGSSALAYGGNGGRGGDAGQAILSQTVIDADGIAEFACGIPGKGGAGGIGYSFGHDGMDGLMKDSVKARHFFSLT